MMDRLTVLERLLSVSSGLGEAILIHSSKSNLLCSAPLPEKAIGRLIGSFESRTFDSDYQATLVFDSYDPKEIADIEAFRECGWRLFGEKRHQSSDSHIENKIRGDNSFPILLHDGSHSVLRINLGYINIDYSAWFVKGSGDYERLTQVEVNY